jgi:drug/metabolite transporter (DMT)-like permease
MLLHLLAIGRDMDVFGRDLRYPVDIHASVVALALGSALCYALAAALQHAATQAYPAGRAARFGLLVALVQRPMWLAGNVADAGGYVLLFLAFRRGSLALVQPLLVTGLLFALPLGTMITHTPVRRNDWIGAAMVVVGLAGFIVAAAPGPGHPSASGMAWVLLALVTVAVLGMLFWLTRMFPGRRAALLGAAAGVLSGVLGAITEAAARAFDHGIMRAFGHWQPYALIVVGFVCILVVQHAFHAGKLSDSLPLLTATETVVGVAIGQWLFGERIAGHPTAHLVEVLGLALLCWGVFVLGRSPVIAGADPDPHQTAEAAEAARAAEAPEGATA